MTEETFNHVINHFAAKCKNIRSEHSSALLEMLTFAQYKNLALIDVQTHVSLFERIEKYLSDYLEALKLETQLKRKKCELAVSLKQLDEKLSEANEAASSRNEKLRNGDVDFLKPPKIVQEQDKEKPKPEPKKEVPLVEPVYSTRVMREKTEKAQPTITVLDSIRKPPTFSSSVNFGKKENVPAKPRQFNLDASLLNDHDITIINEDSRRRLKFDELDDEEEEKPKTTATPVRTVPKPLDLSSMPPPPVFTSNSGRLFNQNKN
uniref:Uncharacterized protein n=1 Tax=Caenorhabditis japonica TaxID=281687 RepID=A0A8R1I7H3_CAEJA